MLGRAVDVPARPERIISLVPSQTELLFDLGVGPRVVGLTRYCVHPAAEVARATVVGGTKTLRMDVVESLDPDLVIGNKEENDRGAIEALAARYPVWMSDVRDLPGAFAMIRQVGDLVGRPGEAEALAVLIEGRFARLPRLVEPLRAAYVIWRKPYMVAGANTFIDAVLTRCGLVNAFGSTSELDEAAGKGDAGSTGSFGASAAAPGSPRYPAVSDADLRLAALDVLLLPSEPFPFDEVYAAELVALLPGVEVRLVDGEMFSWYGSRLVAAADSLSAFVAGLRGGRSDA